MRTIDKGAEPSSLTTHRNTPPCDFDNYADKNALRAALVAEQHGLCCYCMCRIDSGSISMKIEHWHCRTNYRGEELDYRNLLAACPGGEGQPRRLQHCDTRKADEGLLWNPADPQRHVEQRISYGLDGKDPVGRTAVRPATERGSEPEFGVDQNPAKSDPRRGAPVVEETARIGIEAARGAGDRTPQLTATRSVRAGRDLVAGAEAGSRRTVTAVMKRTGEAAFETVIEAHLLANGYVSVPGDAFDRERAIFPAAALDFIRRTQPKEWGRLEALLGPQTGAQILTDLCSWLDAHGALATLRHGFKCYGRTLYAAFFKAAHDLNPELNARYAANRTGITRQLRFSPHSQQSLDVTLSVNGVPVATLELKNPLTGQTVADARRQYRADRDPRAPIFAFKRRTLVHFAVDTESVQMTTRLAGDATRFLPFDRGCGGGAGNPPDPDGRGYRTAYLWEEVLQRDSLLDLLARFIHLQAAEKRDDRGRKVKAETMIFPRYHQLEAVRLLVAAARREGVGHNVLIEHSAGSGKSNTIAWLTHRLASLHDADNARVFDSVIVVTDRVVLDQQLQDTIYQFEHKRGVVRKIDEDSRQLAEALESAAPVIITTLQKFPFVSRQLLRMAEERGAGATGVLPTRRCAVIIDEAHSSQGGETATALKEVLGGAELRAEATARAAGEGLEGEHAQELFLSMAKRGRQPNLSCFAFTATPKHKTLKVFGRGGEPVHRYPMRQAIEEGFILDVLRHYTTYATYYRLLKECADDPQVERKNAAKALARFLKLHPHNIAQKTEIMVEHFHAVTRHRIGGRAKAMVVTGSRLEAVRFKQSFDRYIARKGYPIKSLVAFSGVVEDDRIAGETYTEEQMNAGVREKELPERFATPEYQVLLVAEKYQTGFDQPLLHTMYVDKRLAGIQTVQTLSRLNRTHPLKEDTFVLDFVNDRDEIRAAFAAYALFRAPVEGTRQGKTVLVQLRGAVDPETGARYTLKRYAGERVADGDSWRHAKITLHPVNPEFDPIVLTAADAGELTVVAELVEVLTAAAPAAARG